MACTDCYRTRIGPLWRDHCPTCLWCGARYIQRIGRELTIPKDERGRMRTKALADWVAFGHSEAELRALAKSSEVPLQPIGQDAQPVSERPKPTKRR